MACDTVRGDGKGAVAPFVRELAIDYPILLADDALVGKLDVDAIPTTLFLGPDGRVKSRVRRRRPQWSAGPRRETTGGE